MQRGSGDGMRFAKETNCSPTSAHKNLSPTMVLKFGCHAIMTQNIEWHLNESYNMSNIWSIWLKATILCKAISRW